MATLRAFRAREIMDEFQPVRWQVQILYSQSTVTFLFPMLASAAICFLLWEISPRPVLLGWGVLVMLYSTGRYATLRHYRSAGPARDDFESWHRLFALGVFMSGVLWGAAPIILIPYEPAHLVEFTLYNGLIMIIVSGLVAGAVTAYGVSIRVLLCFVVPALLPPAMYLIHQGDKYNSALGGFVLLYFVFIVASSLRVHHLLIHFIRIEHDREFIQRELDELRRRAAAAGGGVESPLLYQAHFPPG